MLMMPNNDVPRSLATWASAQSRGQAAPPMAGSNRFQQSQAAAGLNGGLQPASQPAVDPLMRSMRAPAAEPLMSHVQPADPLMRSMRPLMAAASPLMRSQRGPQPVRAHSQFSDGRHSMGMAGPSPHWPLAQGAPEPASSSRAPAWASAAAALQRPPAQPMPPMIPGPEVGWYTRQGIKPGNPDWVNQDAQLALQLPGDRLLVGVFDGHGENGHVASGRAKAIMAQLAPSVLGPVNAGPAALRQLFAQVQADFRSQDIFRASGCTASVALIDPVAGSVCLAHVGDSTVALYHRGSLQFESQDHRIDAAAEQRIRSCGGAVQTVGAQQAKRVYMPNGSGYAVGLALDRSLGDLDLTPAGVIGEPEVQANLPFQPGTALIIASDGVWDVVSKDMAAQVITLPDIEESAHALVDSARARWVAGGGGAAGQIDDITAVVVKWWR